MRDGDLIVIGDRGEVEGVIYQVSRTSFCVEVKQGGVVRSRDVVKIPGARI